MVKEEEEEEEEEEVIFLYPLDTSGGSVTVE